jgi:hypothetical protein
MRQADKSKGGYLNIKARTIDEEQQIKNLKSLGVRDSKPYVDLVFEAIELVLAKHRFFYGGNPQLTFDSPLLPTPVLAPKCKCGKSSVRHGLHLASKREYSFCLKCFSDVYGRYDVKVWSWKP